MAELHHSALVVDDDPDVRLLLGTALRRHSIGCDFAADGEEVLHRLKQKQYCVLLLDLMMPNIDGVGVVERMKAAGDPTPVVVITAAGPGLIEKLDRNVVKSVITKPFDIQRIADLVQSMCQADAGRTG